MYDESRQSAASNQPAAGPEIRPFGRPQGRNRSAFTMMEMMIAVAILGIGMTMIAALFPAAIRENQISINDTIGNLICENGLAVAKSVLKKKNIPSTSLSRVAEEFVVVNISQNNQHHPQGTRDEDIAIGRKLYGFVVLGRRTNVEGSYQLIIVSYARERRNPVTDDFPAVMAVAKNVTIADRGTDESVLQNIADSDRKLFAPGGWVITSDGRFARIVGFSGSDLIVKPQLPTTGTMIVWTVVQIMDPSGNVGANPVMSVFTTRTGLQD